MLLRKIELSDFGKHAAVFGTKSPKFKIQESGEAVLLYLYGSSEGNLNALRYKKFCKQISTNRVYVEPKWLPPTSSAVKYHFFRVYFQVQQWMGNADIDPCDWGWYVVAGKLAPVMSDMKPAPQALLKIIRCACKSDCRTKRCTCRKYGLSCTSMCVGCSGSSCSNASPMDIDDE